MPTAVRKTTKEPTKAYSQPLNQAWRSNDLLSYTARLLSSTEAEQGLTPLNGIAL